MNCEVCFEKFEGIAFLINHEATESHQENVKKHENALLGYSAKDIPAVRVATESVVVSAEGLPVSSEPVSAVNETIPVSSESASIVTEAQPAVSAEAVPAVNETIPVSSESAPVVTEAQSVVSAQSVQVAAETVPNTALIVPNVCSSKINNNLFSCIACAMGFSTLSNAVQHSESILHTTMVLATGIGSDEQADTCEDRTDSFPVLYYCIVCNIYCFDSKLYDAHLKTRIHRKIVRRISNLLQGKKDNGNEVCFNDMTSKNGSKLPLQQYCKVCNTQFKSIKGYTRHINGRKHQRIALLMKKISHGKKENVGICFSVKNTESLNNSQHYCQLCNISVNSDQYEKHLMWKTHKRVEQYINTMSFTHDENIDIFDGLNDVEKFNNDVCCLYYCELCNIWCSGSDSYESHWNGKKHGRKMGQKRIVVDPKSPIKDSPPSPRHCEVCNIRCPNSKRYKTHLKSKIHIRIGQILTESSKIKEEDDTVGSCCKANHDTDKSLQLHYYCKLCDALCTCQKSYDSHLQGKTHKTIKKIVGILSNETS